MFSMKAVITKVDADWADFKHQRNEIIRNTKQKYYNEKINKSRTDPTKVQETIKKQVNNKNHKGSKN